MKTTAAALAALTLPLMADAPQSKDREAILAMAGTHEVNFHFHETFAISADYSVKPDAYDETATEVVTVVEDTSERIALQHLLVVPSKGKGPRIIKHWAQIWTWQDTELLDYCGEDGIHEWKRIDLTPEQAAGTWSQLVTQTDDTPRYEGYGKWIHQHGESFWESSPTRRPLPRREYTKREDYDYLLVTNRHSLTGKGWVHFQDNRKIVDRDGNEPHVLCHELGLNTYDRCNSEHESAVLDWWKERSSYWNTVRNFWHDAGEAAATSFAYSTHKDDEALSKRIVRLESENIAPEAIGAALSPYVIAK